MSVKEYIENRIIELKEEASRCDIAGYSRLMYEIQTILYMLEDTNHGHTIQK